MSWLILIALAFVQNVAFSMMGRARNRDNMTYVAICSVFSNGIWFATMHHLVVADLTWWLLIPYLIGTVAGSVFGTKVSMTIEKLIGAKV